MIFTNIRRSILNPVGTGWLLLALYSTVWTRSARWAQLVRVRKLCIPTCRTGFQNTNIRPAENIRKERENLHFVVSPNRNTYTIHIPIWRHGSILILTFDFYVLLEAILHRSILEKTSESWQNYIQNHFRTRVSSIVQQNFRNAFKIYLI